jgi:aquaporin Z
MTATGGKLTMGGALRAHWPEYSIEALGLGLFMVSACALGTLLGHPASPVVESVPDPVARRLLMGLAMGLTAVGLIYSPWGQRSGAHFNPATTLVFWRLGKIATPDAVFYAVSQTIGGLGGVGLAAALIGPPLGDPAVRYVATLPGPRGAAAAFVAEMLIAFVLMTVVLRASNTPGLARFTGLFAGGLVALYIAVEAPISGMSMNPARSLASALPAAAADVLWIYVLAPPVGMLLAADVYVRREGLAGVFCAKLHHDGARRCIFHCRFSEMRAAAHPVALAPEPAARA